MTDLKADFERSALPCMKTVYGGALRLTHNSQDASDLLQETYLRAFRAFSSFTPGTNCKAWLFKIMYSIFVNDYRKKQRLPDPVSFDQVEEQFAGRALTSGFEMDVFRDNAAQVENELRKLPEEFRTAVTLVDVEELTYEEAAAVLSCPVGTVRSRLYRGRKILFLALQDYAKSKGYSGKTR